MASVLFVAVLHHGGPDGVLRRGWRWLVVVVVAVAAAAAAAAVIHGVVKATVTNVPQSQLNK